ncbi:MAG: GNAT family N-acetyltransferase [Victivallales bacterium]|jgi:GNAT superfamily N-acetyltransferase|nr:GNAT family N-acetyltransferase [Victivallales bacterium]
MEPLELRTEDGAITIRPMAGDYIVGDDETQAEVRVEIQCCSGHAVWPNPPYVAYFRRLFDAYGLAAVTAWQGRNLVGFLPAIPLRCGLPQLPHCVSAPIETRVEDIVGAIPTPFSELKPKVLRVQCLSVAGRLQRKGIGLAMARYLVDWARQTGWERIQGWAFAEADTGDAYRWLPSIQFWEKAGFQRGGSCVFDPTDPITNQSGFIFSVDFGAAGADVRQRGGL